MITTFERRRLSPNRLYGTIVSESDSLILIHGEDDFQFNGYTVIRRRDVTRSFTSDSNRYCERLMRKEGLWKRAPKAIRALPVDNWSVLFSALAGRPVEVENERKDDFYIGPVVACDDRFVEIHYFDGCGCWADVEKIRLSSITCATFDDRYSQIYYRHLPPRPESPSKPTGKKRTR